jgi:hypothetical protein
MIGCLKPVRRLVEQPTFDADDAVAANHPFVGAASADGLRLGAGEPVRNL